MHELNLGQKAKVRKTEHNACKISYLARAARFPMV